MKNITWSTSNICFLGWLLLGLIGFGLAAMGF